MIKKIKTNTRNIINFLKARRKKINSLKSRMWEKLELTQEQLELKKLEREYKPRIGEKRLTNLKARQQKFIRSIIKGFVEKAQFEPEEFDKIYQDIINPKKYSLNLYERIIEVARLYSETKKALEAQNKPVEEFFKKTKMNLDK